MIKKIGFKVLDEKKTNILFGWSKSFKNKLREVMHFKKDNVHKDFKINLLGYFKNKMYQYSKKRESAKKN